MLDVVSARGRVVLLSFLVLAACARRKGPSPRDGGGGDAGPTPTDAAGVDGEGGTAGRDAALPQDARTDGTPEARVYPPPVCPAAAPRQLGFSSRAPGDVALAGDDLYYFGNAGVVIDDLATIPVAGGAARGLEADLALIGPSMLRARVGRLAYVDVPQGSGSGQVISVFELQSAVPTRTINVATRVLGLDLAEDGIYYLEAPFTTPETGIVEGATLKRWLSSQTAAETVRTGLRVAPDADLRVVGNQAFWRSRELTTDRPSIETVSVGGLPVAQKVLAVTTYPTDAGTHRPLAVDDTFVYYAAADPGSGYLIQRVSRAGGAPETLARSTMPVASPVVIDDAFVYWVAGSPMAVRKTGGVAFALLTTPAVCRSPVADGKQVICMNDAGASVIPAWWRACTDMELSDRARECDRTRAGSACAPVAPASSGGPRRSAALDFQSNGQTLFFAEPVTGQSNIWLQPLTGTPVGFPRIRDAQKKPSLRVRGAKVAYLRKDYTLVVDDIEVGITDLEVAASGTLLGLALTDDGVYWIEAQNNKLKRRLWSSSDVEVLREGLSVREPDSMMNVAGTQVVWVAATTPPTLVSWTVGAGVVEPSTLATLTASAPPGAGLGPLQVAIDASAVTFADGGRARRVPRGGGAVETLSAASAGFVREVSVDDDFVYWVAGDDGAETVTATPKAGGTSFDVLSVSKASCEALVVDQTHLTCPARTNGNGEWTFSVLPSWWRACDAGGLTAKAAACGLSRP